MPKNKPRRLFLKVSVRNAKGFSRRQVLDTLIASVESGRYKLPKDWRVVLSWKNSERAPYKSGDWNSELRASRRSSSGFDKAVLAYLEDF
jgi:hypothetical protein